MTQKTSGSGLVRGMRFGNSVEIGFGHSSLNIKICPRCNNSRNSAIHKSKCRKNLNPIWS